MCGKNEGQFRCGYSEREGEGGGEEEERVEDEKEGEEEEREKIDGKRTVVLRE